MGPPVCPSTLPHFRCALPLFSVFIGFVFVRMGCALCGSALVGIGGIEVGMTSLAILISGMLSTHHGHPPCRVLSIIVGDHQVVRWMDQNLADWIVSHEVVSRRSKEETQKTHTILFLFSVNNEVRLFIHFTHPLCCFSREVRYALRNCRTLVQLLYYERKPTRPELRNRTLAARTQSWSMRESSPRTSST